MTQALRMRTPPANTDRPSNGATQNSGPPALCLRSPRPTERKAFRGLINRLPSSKPRLSPCGVSVFSCPQSARKRPALVRILLLLSFRKPTAIQFSGSRKHALSPHHAARPQSRCRAEILSGRARIEGGPSRRQRQGEIHAGVFVCRRGRRTAERIQGTRRTAG